MASGPGTTPPSDADRSLWQFRRQVARVFLSNHEYRLALIAFLLPRGWSITREGD